MVLLAGIGWVYCIPGLHIMLLLDFVPGSLLRLQGQLQTRWSVSTPSTVLPTYSRCGDPPLLFPLSFPMSSYPSPTCAPWPSPSHSQSPTSWSTWELCNTPCMYALHTHIMDISKGRNIRWLHTYVWNFEIFQFLSQVPVQCLCLVSFLVGSSGVESTHSTH